MATWEGITGVSSLDGCEPSGSKEVLRIRRPEAKLNAPIMISPNPTLLILRTQEASPLLKTEGNTYLLHDQGYTG